MSHQSRQHPTAPTYEAPGVASQWESTPVAERPGRLVSLFAPAAELDPLSFLRGGYGSERFYWAEPSGDNALTLAGLGVAAEVRVPPVLDDDAPAAGQSDYRFDDVIEQTTRLFEGASFHTADAGDWGVAEVEMDNHPARPRLFGGFAFQDDFVPDNTWSVFSPAHFILPHFQMVKAGNEAFLTINALIAPDEDLMETQNAMREALMARLPAANAHQTHHVVRPSLSYPLSPEMWGQLVNRATTAIGAGEIEKVVLSRVCELRAAEPIDAAATLDFLNAQYGDCYRFLFEPLPHHAFFGATPELLIRKTGPRVQTMALAGSIARGQSTGEDDRLAAQLLASPKERREHSLVVETLRRDLAAELTFLNIPDAPVVLRLKNIQHLLTPIEGQLAKPQLGVVPLLRRLHPTPAMGGAPADRALAFLRRHEPVPRGWYAAPIGWLDRQQDGVFAVAIRSAVTQHARAWLYAGAGIVAESQPAQEWAETALKFRPMLGALGMGEAV